MLSVRPISFIIAIGSTLLGSNAQVTTSCNPLEGVCANDKGLASSSYDIDFTSVKTLPSDWIVANNEKVTLGANGAELSFTKRYDAPAMRTDFNIFFGRVEYVVKAAPGTGIISSMVLLSDDLDEVDWEFRGSITDSVQTNYFGKGYTGTYNRSTTESVSSPQATFHTYAIDWSPTALVWSIDGKAVRTLNAADADGNGSRYPQTPMKISLSLWDGGDPDTNSGTVQWAGGLTPLPPTQPWTMYVKSVKVRNSNPGKLYKYSDKSGSWKSIKVMNETMTSNSSLAVQSTHTLSLAPTTPISTISTGAPFRNMTGSGAPFPNVTSSGAPFPNTTRSCSNSSSVSYKNNGTATATLSPTSLATSRISSMQSPGHSNLNSTKPCSKTSTSPSLAATKSTTPSGHATAAPIPSAPVSDVTSSSFVTSSSSLEAVPQTYTQSPSASTIGGSTLAQTAAPSMAACTCNPPSQAAPSVSSPAASYTTTSPTATAAAPTTPTPAVTPVGGSPNNPADTTANSPSATANPFTNTDDGDTITDIPDSPTTDTPEDDTTTTTSTTRTTSVTLFLTSVGTGASTGIVPTGAPYPYKNGSHVPAKGSLASTGASASRHSKATSLPLPYSLGAGDRLGVGSSMAVVAGTMVGFWVLL